MVFFRVTRFVSLEVANESSAIICHYLVGYGGPTEKGIEIQSQLSQSGSCAIATDLYKLNGRFSLRPSR